MRVFAAIVCTISCYALTSAFPTEAVGGDDNIAHTGPHVESSHAESPSLATPPPPPQANPPYPIGDPNGVGPAPLNASSAIPPVEPKPKNGPKSTGNGGNGTSPSNPKPGRLPSGTEGSDDSSSQSQPDPQPKPAALAAPEASTQTSTLIAPKPAAQETPKPAALDGARPVSAVEAPKPTSLPAPKPSLIVPKPAALVADNSPREMGPTPTSAFYDIPEAGEPQPRVSATAPALPMAMVHSEAGLNTAHTMQPGDSILTVGVDPIMSSLVLGMDVGGTSMQKPVPARATGAVQGATFAAGGQTYTASIRDDMNVVVGSSVLKPGGGAATLGGGVAVISVVPGGALVVDGGTLTMSAIHPPVTGCVISLNGRLVTAQRTGLNGMYMVIGSATVTAGAPAITVDGQRISLGTEGLHLGDQLAVLSTITPSVATSSPTPSLLGPSKGASGLARMSGSQSASARPLITTLPMHSRADLVRIGRLAMLPMPLLVVLGQFLWGG